MQFSSLLGHSAQLLRMVLKQSRPADTIASEYFRSKKYIGSSDRRFIGETVFAVLRSYALLAECCGYPPLPSALHRTAVLHEELLLVLAHCVCGRMMGVIDEESALCEQIEKISSDTMSVSTDTTAYHAWLQMNYEQAGTLHDVAPQSDAVESILTRWYALRKTHHGYGLQAWMQDSLRNSHALALSDDELQQLGASLLAPAPLCLRVNRLKSSRSAVLEQLQREGIMAEEGRLSPDTLIIRKRINFLQHPLYLHGIIEVQDEASQLLAFALCPEPTMTILDACAGAGGKSLHIASLQANSGKVISADIEFGRLKEIKGRAERHGITSIRTIHTKSANKQSTHDALPPELASLHHTCDAVVVDAPCSGMGTVRRMPMVKWTLTPAIAVKHQTKQSALLSQYAHAVAPGGILLYATCSLLPEENEWVAEEFTATHKDFIPEPLAPIFERSGIRIPYLHDDAYYVGLLPSRHDTDGFFLARWRRRV